jgi:hypothetical protein
MHVDTTEFMALRGEVNGLNEAVRVLARRRQQDRDEVEEELGQLRDKIAELAIFIAEGLDTMQIPGEPQLRAVDSGRRGGQHAKPRRGRLQLLR